METRDSLIRVERGHPDEMELAAVVAVLLARRAGAVESDEGSPASGIRWWRKPDAYTAPDSWR
jgi:hypothetical protein